MHQHSIIHRYLKPENILIDSDLNPRIRFPEILTSTIQFIMTIKIGTLLHMAPELFTDDEDNQYGPGVDVYVSSILIYENVTENCKYLSLSGLIKKVLSGERPFFNELTTEKMQNLISQCWSTNPNERPSFDEIYNRFSEDFFI